MKRFFVLFIYLLLPFIFLFLNLKSLYADRLECKFDDYANSTYRDSIAKSWIPPIQTHEIQGKDIIHHAYRSIKGTIVEDSDNKIKWRYYRDSKDSKGQLSRTTFKFIFFKTTKKASAEIDFTGFRDIVSVWGTCDYIHSNSKVVNEKKEDDQVASNISSNQIKILDGEFKLIRSSGSSDLFYNKATSTVLLKSNNKWYNKMHKQLIDNADYDIRFGLFWDKEKKKSKKYMFNYNKPNSIIAKLNGYVREIYIQDNSLSTIIDNNEKYFYFSITDYNEGMWFANRSEVSQ
tara:strand:- start:78 stop:947 length:870 start_codon:yes stop_codon:yes gene_type:complete